MYLKRIYGRIVNRDWVALMTEVIVIVAGVFIGLQASNWNEDRIERGQEREILIRLHEDILASAQGIEQDNGFLESQLIAQFNVMEALDNCKITESAQEIVQSGFRHLGLVSSPRFFRRTVDELGGSGRVDIIRSKKIKTELATIVSEVEWRVGIKDSTFRLIEHHRQFIDEQVRYEVPNSVDTHFSAVSVDLNIQQLCEEPRVAAAVSAINFYSREHLDAHRELHKLYLNFLPLVENELQSRWAYHVGDSQTKQRQ